MRPFTDILREHRGGRLAAQATELMNELVRAVDATNKKGELTLKITVKPEKGGGSQKVLDGKVTIKRPEHDVAESIFFSDSDGDLHRDDPDQREMFAEVGRRGVSGADLREAGEN